MSKFRKFVGKLSPKRAVDAIVRRKVVSAVVAVIVATLAAYGFDLTPEIQKALVSLGEAIVLAF